jgi:hypothetical protein
LLGNFGAGKNDGIEGIQLEVHIGAEEVRETLRQAPFRIIALDF